MHDLVLLSDEVLFLKQTALQSVKASNDRPFSYELACESLCARGLTGREGQTLRLTPIGHRVARKLIADDASGTVWLQRSQLKVLGLIESDLGGGNALTGTLGERQN